MLVVILVLGGFVWIKHNEAEQYKWHLEAGYQHYFGSLVESIDKINSSLHKGMYARTSAMVATLSNEVSRQSALAVSALSGLPFSHIELERTSKFLSQVGDYSYALTKKDAMGEGITEEEAASMKELADIAYQLSVSLGDLYYRVVEEGLWIGEVQPQKQSAEPGSIESVSDTLSELEMQFPEYAGLIYDGPFSEHITQRESKLLCEMKDVDEARAKEIMASALDIDKGQIESDGISNSNIKIYSLRAEQGGSYAYADVTVQGGRLMSLMKSREPGEPQLTAEQCMEKAKTFMEKLDINGMEESYYLIQENVITLNYAYSKDDILYYPDLVKVSVAMDNGDIIGFESRGYLMNHVERDIPEIAVSEEQARANLAQELTVESSRLAVIPSPGENELFCHEFKCTDEKGQEYLIYVNVETGNEEQILILIVEENGTLTM